MSKEERVRFLLHKYLDDELSPGEAVILKELLDQDGYQAVTDELLEKVWNNDDASAVIGNNDWKVALEQVFQKVESPRGEPHDPVVRKFVNRGRWYAAAAVFLITFGVGLLLFRGAGGTSFFSEELFNEGVAAVARTGAGQIRMLTLPDGSRVWLNARSTLNYPAEFSEKERVVTLDGEGYFEIFSDKARPFLVKAGPVEVQVLGTHFNVSAYRSSRSVTTTLFEGVVELKHKSMSKRLYPGQQAAYSDLADELALSSADTAVVMAWKRGEFHFDDTPVQEIMQQLSEWYGLSVVYAGGIPDIRLSGIIPREQNVARALEILEATQRIRFNLQHDTVTVTKINL